MQTDDAKVDFLQVIITAPSKTVKDMVEEYFEAVFNAETLEEDSDADEATLIQANAKVNSAWVVAITAATTEDNTIKEYYNAIFEAEKTEK